jgi:phosphoribosylamine--glycine ligase
MVLEWDERDAVCIVAASGGYPGSYEQGVPIEGLTPAGEDSQEAGLWVYHAGTRCGETGETLTAGGRVLGVTALGETREAASKKAYEALAGISFDGLHSRSDIGQTMAN